MTSRLCLRPRLCRGMKSKLGPYVAYSTLAIAGSIVTFVFALAVLPAMILKGDQDRTDCRNGHQQIDVEITVDEQRL